VKRVSVVLISVLALFTINATLGGATWSAAASPSTPQIIFDDVGQQAKLVIPTPPCPTTQPDCQWKFVVQIPEGDITVGVVFGTSGTLVIPYPANFCGVIQADAYRGPPFVPQRGFQHTIETCHTTPTTSTTTTSTSTTSTTTTTEPKPVPPPMVTPQRTSPPPALPVEPPVTPPTPVVTTTPTQLPFTGVNTKPMLFVGLTLMALGVALLTSASTWRRMGRQALATLHGPAVRRLQ